MTRLIHRSAVVLSSLLIFSACDKKEESSSSSPNAEEASPGKSSKSSRSGRGTRSERETVAKSELRAAFEAAEKEPDPVAREKAIAQVAWDAIDVDRKLAQQAFDSLTPGSEEARKLIAHFAMRMAEDDPEVALQWARNLVEAEERDDALGRIAAVVADKDPTRAASLATDELPEGPMRNRAVIQVAQRWAQSSPAKAGNWVSTLPDGSARRGAIVMLAKSWSESDAAGFASWAAAKEAQLPELLSSVATVYRNIPDEKVRAERIAEIPDAAFRQRVESEILRSSQLVLPK